MTSIVNGNRYLFLRSLSAVFGTGLLSVSNTCGVQGSTDDVVSGTGQVLNSSSTDQHNAVLLKVVTLSRNVACYLDSVGKTYTGNLSKSRVRLLRSCGFNSCTNTTLLRGGQICRLLSQRVKAFLQSRSGRFLNAGLTSFTYSLVKCRHSFHLL